MKIIEEKQEIKKRKEEATREREETRRKKSILKLLEGTTTTVLLVSSKHKHKSILISRMFCIEVCGVCIFIIGQQVQEQTQTATSSQGGRTSRSSVQRDREHLHEWRVQVYISPYHFVLLSWS